MALTGKKLVVVDFDIPELLDNKLFDPITANKVSHTLLPFVYLYNEAKKLGIDLVTADVYLGMAEKPGNVLLYSHLTTPFTDRLIAAGVKPTVLTCQESPFIATRFYANLTKYSRPFKHSFVFSGMRKRLAPQTVYHQMFFPENYTPQTFRALPFGQKKFLAMVSGNKRIGNRRKTFLMKLMYGFSVKEIYGQRQKAINFFADSGKFDLYGVGWQRGGLTAQDSANINKVYRGKVDNKLDTLRNYKFALCFENSVFSGYVTEKIFDVMFAGCVPVYLGAPDIAGYVPKEAFIDVRHFSNYGQMSEFLTTMDEQVYNAYIINIKKFLSSPQFYRFSQENFAKEILSIFEKEFNG